MPSDTKALRREIEALKKQVAALEEENVDLRRLVRPVEAPWTLRVSTSTPWFIQTPSAHTQ